MPMALLMFKGTSERSYTGRELFDVHSNSRNSDELIVSDSLPSCLANPSSMAVKISQMRLSVVGAHTITSCSGHDRRFVELHGHTIFHDELVFNQPISI